MNQARTYISINVDSTPDVAHIDELSFIIKYVNDDCYSTEIFLKFIPNVGHRSQNFLMQ